MPRKQFRHKAKNRKGFWDKEYKKGEHLRLSTEPSEDLLKFTRFLERQSGKKLLNVTASVLDLGCGNGRNLVYLAKNFGMSGVGFDISKEAIAQAKELSENLPIKYEVRSIAGDLNLPENSQTIVLDMMASHFLDETERKQLLAEIDKVLKPGGWFLYKTFLLDEDEHARKLLKKHPGEERGTYIHPKFGLAEHVSTEKEIEENLSQYFTIEKIIKSYKHRLRGRAHKRRSIMIYAQKS